MIVIGMIHSRLDADEVAGRGLAHASEVPVTWYDVADHDGTPALTVNIPDVPDQSLYTTGAIVAFRDVRKAEGPIGKHGDWLEWYWADSAAIV